MLEWWGNSSITMKRVPLLSRMFHVLFSLGCWLIFLIANHYRVGHYIERSGAVQDDLIDGLGGTKLRVAYPEMRCFNKDEASLTWQGVRNVFGVTKRGFLTCLVISSACIRCGDIEELIVHTSFHYPVVRPVCKLFWKLHDLRTECKIFVVEASSVCSNVVPSKDCISLHKWVTWVGRCDKWNSSKVNLSHLRH